MAIPVPDAHVGDMPQLVRKITNGKKIIDVSVGKVDGRVLLDLDYVEDVAADVDMNVVMTGSGRFVEVQGTGEEATFTRAELDRLVQTASRGIKSLLEMQERALRRRIP